MSGTLRQMLTCHWSARRIQRYLDADPGAPLTPGEIARLEEHLATCERCRRVVDQHRSLHRALSWWSGGVAVEPASVERIRGFVGTLTSDETP